MRYQGLKQEAYDYIFDLLMSARFKQGDRIREDQIAEEMGVSRTPVREAVNQLVAEGFIVNIPRKGLFAAQISKEDIRKMIDVRIVLEVLAIESCCELITDEELKKLEDVYAEYCKKVETFDQVAVAQSDKEFHTCIVSFTRNKKLEQFIKDLLDSFTYAKVQINHMNNEGILRSKEDHRAILDTIQARDIQKARDLMETHLHRLKYMVDSEDET